MLTRIDPPLNNYVYILCVQKQIKEKLYKKKFKLGTYLFKFIYTNIAGPFSVIGYN
jgi:hypothetical protein